MRISAEIRRSVWWLITAATAGALTGALAGWWAAGWTIEVGGFISSSTGLSLQFRTATGTPPIGGVTVIPIENRPPAVVLPPPFAERGASSAAALYRRIVQKKADDGLLTEDRLLGQAVAVTSDGWFAAAQSELDGLSGGAEVIVWHDGKAATATRAVSDRLSGVVFLKTDLSGLPAPRLAGAREVSQNAAVWLERRARRFEAAGVASLSDPAASLDGVSSEATLRRPSLTVSPSGGTLAGDLGAPVWSTDGSLLGLVSAASASGLRFIPAASWSSSLQSLLASGEIRHAYLGVRSVDLSSVKLESPPFGLPVRGAWLRDDKRNKKPAVERNSPAATAGLRAGDVIQSIDRDIIDESADLAELLAGYKPGSQVTLTVLRGGQTLEIPVTLGSIVTSEEIRN